MNEVYRLAHNLIDMAKDGAPLNEVADSLMRLKQLNENKVDEAGMMLAIVVPVQITKDRVIGRYPLNMYKSHGVKTEGGKKIMGYWFDECVVMTWPQEQHLRKLGYKTQEEMRHEEGK